jgi:hypothetical protein
MKIAEESWFHMSNKIKMLYHLLFNNTKESSNQPRKFLILFCTIQETVYKTKNRKKMLSWMLRQL